REVGIGCVVANHQFPVRIRLSEDALYSPGQPISVVPDWNCHREPHRHHPGRPGLCLTWWVCCTPRMPAATVERPQRLAQPRRRFCAPGQKSCAVSTPKSTGLVPKRRSALAGLVPLTLGLDGSARLPCGCCAAALTRT